VCLLPGTELAFDKKVERDHAFGRLLPSMQFGKLGDQVARFRKVNMERPNAYHDALEFPDGGSCWSPPAQRPAYKRAAVTNVAPRHQRSGLRHPPSLQILPCVDPAQATAAN
jgi:hypothetical protein